MPFQEQEYFYIPLESKQTKDYNDDNEIIDLINNFLNKP
jgi:hypothetical protein